MAHLEKLWKTFRKSYIYIVSRLNIMFYINEKFLADNEKNEVLNCETKTKNKLEPRLMKLLCLLAEQNGRLVRRELIIEEVWDNYPGASEGLNQAISSLRRILGDE